MRKISNVLLRKIFFSCAILSFLGLASCSHQKRWDGFCAYYAFAFCISVPQEVHVAFRRGPDFLTHELWADGNIIAVINEDSTPQSMEEFDFCFETKKIFGGTVEVAERNVGDVRIILIKMRQYIKNKYTTYYIEIVSYRKYEELFSVMDNLKLLSGET